MNQFFKQQWKYLATVIVSVVLVCGAGVYSHGRISTLDDSVHTLETTVAQTKDSLSQESSKSQSLQKQLDSANEAIEQDKSTINEQESKIQTLQKKLESLNQYDKQIADLKDENSKLTEENKSLKSKVASLESDNKELKSDNSSLQKKITSASADTNYKEETESESSSYTVYITNTGSKYHRAGCRYLRQSQHKISKEEAESEGYTPCSVCNP